MTDDELLRYSRHILLNDIGVEGQQCWLASHALVIGAGGLGCAALLYLASAGVGHITVLDGDTVDATNLQRQIAHATDRVGQAKVQSAATAMRALNPGVHIDAIAQRADAALLATLVPQAQVVLDCSDNFATRQAVNAACVQHRVPLVVGAALQMDGQCLVVDTRAPDPQAKAPCWACLFAPAVVPEEARCATMGVLAPLVGVVGTWQAMLALQLLLPARLGDVLTGRLHVWDARDARHAEMLAARRPGCPVCGQLHHAA
jgi:molybdopterin-synthase adenylyltransferase